MESEQSCLSRFRRSELSQSLGSIPLSDLQGAVVKATTREKVKKFPVSDLNLKRAAIRLLGQKLVSNEVLYIQRQLGATATQQQLDENVVAVRKLPWVQIAITD